jgi:hypothetical protein
MNRTMPARLGALVAASAAVFAFSTAPSLAAQPNGANDSCPSGYFCTNPDKWNTASENGNGNGNAYGKPNQATAGSSDINPADKKNPPGQSAGDGNNGYECDGNNGIAKGNPAHTACYGGGY